MQKSVIVLVILLLARTACTQIVLSEIMFNPSGNERYDEFVELYNAGENKAVDLTGWLLSDSSKYSIILPYGESALLAPHRFAVILVPNYFEKSRIYDAEIPDDALLLTIGNAQIGAYGLKNSDGERVSLHRPDSTLVAAFKYSPDNKDGFSEEKIDLFAGDEPGNWSNSIKAGGTPGYKNSVTPSAFDLTLSSFAVAPQRPSSEDSVVIKLGVKNVGKEAADFVDVRVATSSDSAQDVLLSERYDGAIAPGDSMLIVETLPPFSLGAHSLTAQISHPRDESEINNQLDAQFEVVAAYAAGTVVINELMYDTDEKADEWIELFNASTERVLLRDWSISDARKSAVIVDSAISLKPDGYCVLANRPLPTADSSFQIILSLPELNNSGDELTLRDAAGTLIDSIAYKKKFGGGRNVSLERVRYEDGSQAENWATCRDSLSSTPGRRNSVSPKAQDAAIDGASFHVNPRQPSSGEKVNLSVPVLNSGREPVEDIRIDFVYTLLSFISFRPLGSEYIAHLGVGEKALVEIQWENIPAGVYVVRAEVMTAGDMDEENNAAMDTLFVSDSRKPLVINEIMYSPVNGMGEWIELYNRCDYAVQLIGYAIAKSDSTLTRPFCDELFDLAPGGFVVFAHDSSIVDICDAPVFVSRAMPSLKNDADELFLYDGNGRLVDQLSYSDTMGGARGRSLERINPQVNSAEPSNWTTCVSDAGHTCGLRNSVAIDVLPETVALAVQPNPFSPDGDGIDDFVGISYSMPARTAQVNIKIYDIAGRLVRFLSNNEASGAQRTIFWDGANDEGGRCAMGVYIIFLEALNETAMCIERVKKTVVLAGAL